LSLARLKTTHEPDQFAALATRHSANPIFPVGPSD
jgi:hypothetical protein